MTVTTQRRGQTQFAPQPQPAPPTQPRQLQSYQPQVKSNRQSQVKKSRKSQKATSLVVPGLKASLIGGAGICILILIGLIPPPDNVPFVSIILAFLVIAGFFVVCLSTGGLAGLFAGNDVKSTYQGGKVGWLAGFWAGVYGGIFAMLLAAIGVSVFGLPTANFGQGVVNQFTPEQLAGLANYGLTSGAIALVGRVFSTLLILGVIGSLISALLSLVGGMIYPKLSRSN